MAGEIRSGYITAIDGLRAIAVLSIILFHLDPAFCPGGFVGVDIFFVISGFVVARSSEGMASRSFLTFLASFYRRRLLRIYPALIVMVLVTALVAGLLLPIAPDTNYILPTGVASLAGVSNIFLYMFEDSYFAASSQYNLFTHTWSLGVEEQYYLLFPFLAALVFSRRAGKRRLGMLALLLLTLGSLLYLVISKHGPFSFYMIMTRFWELGLGFLLHIYRKPIGTFLSSSAPRGLFGGMGLGLLALAFLFAREGAFPWAWALAPTIGTALLIAACMSSEDDALPRLLSLPPLRFIGAISYSLYLWHWVVIVGIRWLGPADRTTAIALAVIAMTVLATLSTKLLEEPLRRASFFRRLGTPRFLALAGLSILVSLGLAAIPVLARARLSLSSTKDLMTWSTTAIPPRGDSDCSVDVKTDRAAGGRFITFTPKGCSKTGGQSGHRLLIAGDSHAGAYWRLGYRLASTEGMTVELMTQGGCSIILFNDQSQAENCGPYRAAVDRKIMTDAKAGDHVLISGLYLHRYESALGGPREKEAAPTPAMSDADIEALLGRLKGTGAEIVLEAPKPILKKPAFRCADPWTARNATCSEPVKPFARAELEAMRQPVLARMSALAKTSGAKVWDPFATLCPGETCDGQKDGKPIFYDTDHLSGFGNDILLPDFLKTALTN